MVCSLWNRSWIFKYYFERIPDFEWLIESNWTVFSSFVSYFHSSFILLSIYLFIYVFISLFIYAFTCFWGSGKCFAQFFSKRICTIFVSDGVKMYKGVIVTYFEAFPRHYSNQPLAGVQTRDLKIISKSTKFYASTS